MAPILIVGGGLAGWTLARELRKRSPQQPVRLVTRDGGDYYPKPALSNALAAGKAPETLVTTPAAAMSAQLGVELQARTRVQRIDRDRRLVLTDQGAIPYGTLVLALGADPIRLPLEGDAVGTVMSVNDLDDYRALRRTLRPGHRVAVLGAGLIGCEFANDLALGGHAVTVVDPAAHALPTLLPEAAAREVERALAALGVRWRLGDAVTGVDRTSTGLCLRTRTGAAFDADVVLSAVGLRPRIALAAEAGLATGRGILVDDFGRTSDPSIRALGDCAQYPDGVRPYVQPTMTAARAIAASLCGEAEAIRFPTLPVIVKTPACPVAAVAPAPSTAGHWTFERDGSGIEARFLDASSQLAGFALTGPATARRQALARAMDAARAARDDAAPAARDEVARATPGDAARASETAPAGA